MMKFSFKNPFANLKNKISSEDDNEDDIHDAKPSHGHHSPRTPRKVHFTPSTKPESSNHNQAHGSKHTPRTPHPVATPSPVKSKAKAPKSPQPLSTPRPPSKPKSKPKTPRLAVPPSLPEAPSPPKNPSPLTRISPHDLPLSLSTLWYTHWPPTPFPPPHLSLLPASKRLVAHSQKTGTSPTNPKLTYFTSTLQFQDLKRTKIHLLFDPKNPKQTVQVTQRHYFPSKLTSSDLEKAREKYSEGVARYCESKQGKIVGNGECWTLARDALRAVGERCKTRDLEPCFESLGHVHGYLLLALPLPSSASSSSSSSISAAVKNSGLGRGDIVQFSTAVFRMKTDKETRTVQAGIPDHTAVIMGVKGTKVFCLEQSGKDKKGVGRMEYEFECLKEGGLKVYRAVGEKWGRGVEVK